MKMAPLNVLFQVVVYLLKINLLGISILLKRDVRLLLE